MNILNEFRSNTMPIVNCGERCRTPAGRLGPSWGCSIVGTIPDRRTTIEVGSILHTIRGLRSRRYDVMVDLTNQALTAVLIRATGPEFELVISARQWYRIGSNASPATP
jgi:ADP-heptose:LPS heptosyltransferase